MTVLETAKKMIDYSHGNLHDINHFMKVYAYAKMIADGEQLDPDTQKLVEMTALVHDIACPLCREKYGNTNGKYQEQEGAVLVHVFLAGTGMTEDAYWASMFETRKLMLTLENYTQAQKAAFLAAGHAPDETDAWHDFCYTLTKAAVDAQNITLAAPYSWTLTRENYNDTGTWPELTQSTGTPG